MLDLRSRLRHRQPPRETKSRRVNWRSLVPTAASGAAGAAIMFLVDPDRGRRRRTYARDKTAALVRHSGRRVGRTTRRTRATIYGLFQKARHLPHRPAPAASDQMVTDRILSQAFRDLDVPLGRINVNVEEGVAVLHGALDRAEQIHKVEAAVKKIAGVRGVESYLHLPSTPAPEESPRG
jgi:BON domain-containing protein